MTIYSHLDLLCSTRQNNTVYSTVILADSDDSGDCIFGPLIFDMGTLSGQMEFVVTLNASLDSVYMEVRVFANYLAYTQGSLDCNNTVTSGCLCGSGRTHIEKKTGSFTYSYTAEEDRCHAKTNLFGEQRYFLVTLFNDDAPVVYNAELMITGSTNGTLDLTNFIGMKPCEPCGNSSTTGNTRSFTCYLPYGFFFSEIGQDNQIFLHTHYHNCGSCYNTLVTVLLTDSFRSDVIVMVSVLMIVIIITVILLYRYEDVGKIHRFTWRFCRDRVVRRTYQALM